MCTMKVVQEQVMECGFCTLKNIEISFFSASFKSQLEQAVKGRNMRGEVAYKATHSS